MFIDAQTLTGKTVRLEPLALHHKEALRAVCAQDQDVWEYYPISLVGEHYDSWWRGIENWSESDVRVPFAVMSRDNGSICHCIGLTSFYRWADTPDSMVCIGSTFYAPSQRGTKVNPECKLLLLDHAFALGKTEVIFHVDVRNQRSKAAMRKLGAEYKETLLKHMTTWTGHVRDSVVFSITSKSWPEIRTRLIQRLQPA
jgi:N-acetyltransferase